MCTGRPERRSAPTKQTEKTAPCDCFIRLSKEGRGVFWTHSTYAERVCQGPPPSTDVRPRWGRHRAGASSDMAIMRQSLSQKTGMRWGEPGLERVSPWNPSESLNLGDERAQDASPRCCLVELPRGATRAKKEKG